MGIFIIDFLEMEDKQSLYDMLYNVLRLPDYFSSNLDSLADCLDEFNSNNVIILQNTYALIDVLGEYGEKVLKIFQEKSNEKYSYSLIVK